MLLSEVITTRREIEPGKFEYTPDIEQSLTSDKTKMGVETLPVNFQKEERSFFKKRGITNIPDIPVLYTWSYEKPSKTYSTVDAFEYGKGEMDAFKDRNPDHTMSKQNLEKIYKSGVHRLLNTSPGRLIGASDVVKNQYRMIQQMFTALKLPNHAEKRGNTIIVPLSSSSSVIAMIAKEIQDASGLTVLNGAFKKNQWPRLSEYIRTTTGGEQYKKRDAINKTTGIPDTTRTKSPHNQLKQLKQQQRFYIQKISELENKDFDTDKELNAITTELQSCQIKLEQIETKLQRTFKISNQQAPGGDMNRGYYNYQLATPVAKELAGKHIILIDDNVVSGYTMADAVKSLYRNGIIPASVVGIVPHKYNSFKKEDDKPKNKVVKY